MTHNPIYVQYTADLRKQALLMSRINFYLWMFVAQNDLYEDALDFISMRHDIPTPFEEWNISLLANIPDGVLDDDNDEF